MLILMFVSMCLSYQHLRRCSNLLEALVWWKTEKTVTKKNCEAQYVNISSYFNANKKLIMMVNV